MRMLKMCLNLKVLAGLAMAGVAIYLIAPNLIGEALTLLLLAACPLSMLLMTWGTQHAHGQQTIQEPDAGLICEERIARPRTQQASLAEQIGTLEREEASGSRDKEREDARTGPVERVVEDHPERTKT